MTSTLFKTTYSLREDIYRTMARREKSLQAKPIKELRSAVAKKKLMDMKKHRLTKTQLVYLLMENQYGDHRMEAYTNVQMERSAPKHP